MSSWVLRNVTKLGAILLAFLVFFSAGVVGKIMLLGIAAVVVYGYLAAKGDRAGYATKGIAGAAVFVWHSLLSFGALLASTAWGRAVMAGGVVLMLADASWGSDSVGIPVIGTFGLFFLGLAVGGRQYRRRMRWEDAVGESIRAAVPGYTYTRDPEVRFGSGGGVVARLGRYAGDSGFSFRIPREVRRAVIPEIEEHLREVFPAAEGATLGVDWRQRAGWAYARVIEDLPTSITIDQLDAVEASAAGYASAAAREGTGNPTLIPLGATRDGLIVWDCGNLYGSALFAGAPGGGKSCAIRTVIHHCFRYSADWDLYLIDPKRVELGPMRKYPEVNQVATDDGAAEQVLVRAAHEQARRYAALERVGVQNIHELNSRLESKGRRRLKHIMVVVDEVAELVELSGGKDEESKEADARKVGMKKSIDSIARLGRAAGVHLILATQRPDATFISGATKSNIQARLAMGGLSSAGSEMTIESPMAANLPGISGRGIWYQSGRLAETQIYYTSMDHMTEASRGGKS